VVDDRADAEAVEFDHVTGDERIVWVVHEVVCWAREVLLSSLGIGLCVELKDLITHLSDLLVPLPPWHTDFDGLAHPARGNNYTNDLSVDFGFVPLRLFFWRQGIACRVLQVLDWNVMCESLAECVLDVGFAR
jgi:hypothetical protein